MFPPYIILNFEKSFNLSFVEREFCVQYETQYEVVLVLKRSYSYSYVFVVRVGTTSYQYDLVLVRPRFKIPVDAMQKF